MPAAIIRKVNNIRYGVRPVPVIGNPWQYIVAEQGGFECTTICRDDCTALCHESHYEASLRSHDPFVCQSIQLNVLNEHRPTTPVRHAGRYRSSSAS